MMHIEVPDEIIVENLYLKLEVGRDLFDGILEHYGKEGWNAYSRRLLRHSIWAMYSAPDSTGDALTRIRVKDANLCSFWGALA